MDFRKNKERTIFFAILGATFAVVIIVLIIVLISKTVGNRETRIEGNITKVSLNTQNVENTVEDEPNDDEETDNDISNYAGTWRYSTAYKGADEVEISTVYNYNASKSKKFIELNSDGTFVDNIKNETNATALNQNNIGKYEVENKTINLTYKDDTTAKIRIYLSTNKTYLIYQQGEYNIHLEKLTEENNWEYKQDISKDNDIETIIGLSLLWIYSSDQDSYDCYKVTGENDAIKYYVIYSDRLVIAIDKNVSTPYTNFELEINSKNLSETPEHIANGLSITETDEDENQLLVFEFDKEFKKGEIKNLTLSFGDTD